MREFERPDMVDPELPSPWGELAAFLSDLDEQVEQFQGSIALPANAAAIVKNLRGQIAGAGLLTILSAGVTNSADTAKPPHTGTE